MNSQPLKPTRRGRATQKAIDEAARKVISEKGFLAMTVADITAEAGKSPGSFYNYYDSKEALLEAWARRFQSEARRRVELGSAGGTPRDRVEAAARGHWDTYREHLAEMIGVYQLSMINVDFAAVWHELTQEAVDNIAHGVRRAQAQGYCPGIDPVLTARAIVSLLNQFCYDNLANGREAEVDDEACVATLTDIWYRAVFWR